MASNREINAVLRLKADGKVDVQQLRLELEKFGDEGVKAGQKIEDGSTVMEKSLGRVEKAFAQGKNASQNNVEAMVVSYNNLRNEVVQAFGSIEKAPKAAQEALDYYGTRVDAARAKFVTTKNVTKDLSTELNVAGETWTGLGNAVEKAAGKFGPAIAKVGQFSAAFGTGWAMGTKFAKEIGTNFDEMNHVLDEAKGRIGNLVTAWSEGVAALASGEWGEFVTNIKLGTSALTMNAEALKGWKLALELGLSDVDQLKNNQETLTFLQQAYTFAVSAGADGTKLWNQAVRESGGDSDTLIAKLGDLIPQFELLKVTLDDANKAQADRNELITAGIKNTDNVLASLQKERLERELGIDSLNAEAALAQKREAAIKDMIGLTDQSSFAQGQLNASVQQSVQWIEDETSKMEPRNKVLERAIDLLKQTVKDGYEPANKEQQGYIDTLLGIKGKYEDLDPVEKGRIQMAAQMLASQLGLNEAAAASQVVLDPLTGTIKTIGDNSSTAAGEIETFKDSLSMGALDNALKGTQGELQAMALIAKDSLSSMIPFVDEVTEAVSRLEGAAERARAKMESLAKAGLLDDDSGPNAAPTPPKPTTRQYGSNL